MFKIFLPGTNLFGGVFLRSENFLFISVPGKKTGLLLEYDGVHWGTWSVQSYTGVCYESAS
jgi:hypothetical protein